MGNQPYAEFLDSFLSDEYHAAAQSNAKPTTNEQKIVGETIRAAAAEETLPHIEFIDIELSEHKNGSNKLESGQQAGQIQRETSGHSELPLDLD